MDRWYLVFFLVALNFLVLQTFYGMNENELENSFHKLSKSSENLKNLMSELDEEFECLTTQSEHLEREKTQPQVKNIAASYPPAKENKKQNVRKQDAIHYTRIYGLTSIIIHVLRLDDITKQPTGALTYKKDFKTNNEIICCRAANSLTTLDQLTKEPRPQKATRNYDKFDIAILKKLQKIALGWEEEKPEIRLKLLTRERHFTHTEVFADKKLLHRAKPIKN